MAHTSNQPGVPLRSASPAPKLIDITAHKHLGPFRAWIGSPLERTLGLDRLNRHYGRYCRELASSDAPADAFGLALDVLGLTYTLDRSERAKVPSEGPLVVVANHPFGGLEGLLLGKILSDVRSDVRLMGNVLLKGVAGINGFIIAVDPFQSRSAVDTNRRGLTQALDWLKQGGLLATFPSGEVSSFGPGRWKIQDPAWSPHIGALIQRTGAGALPVYFPGRNSLAFQLLGMVHPRLRTAMLPRELLNKASRDIAVRIGTPISRHQLRRFQTDAERVAYLRTATYLLAHRDDTRQVRHAPLAAPGMPIPPDRKPIARPGAKTSWTNEIRRLPNGQRLVEHGPYAVYIAEATQIPRLLQEIGRLREVTFREAHEGTGETIDIDGFDAYYQHLFLWHTGRNELVGAYRLGMTNPILRDRGPAGLYTHQLFKFQPELLARLANAIEFGRSFIRSEYQKKFHSLMLLWKGIGTFVARNPRNNLLFGAVSISNDYQKVSRNLMVRFLKEKRYDRSLARLVTPRNPYRGRRIEGISRHLLRTSFQDIGDVSVLISEIEKDGKGIPVLLRQYLNLNGKFLSFNVDRHFSDVVDGLLVVDLKESDPRLLKRFMGPQGFARFRAYHRHAQNGAHADPAGAKETRGGDQAA